MPLEVLGERVERGFNRGVVGQPGWCTEAGEIRAAEVVAGEQPVDIRSPDQSVGRLRAIAAAGKIEQRPSAVWTGRGADVDLVAGDGLAACDVPAADLD